MCVYSMVIDGTLENWRKNYPNIQPWNPPETYPFAGTASNIFEPMATKEELDLLRRDFEDFKTLVKKAIEYDKRSNQPNCESEDKLELVKNIAKLIGVDIADILPKGN